MAEEKQNKQESNKEKKKMNKEGKTKKENLENKKVKDKEKQKTQKEMTKPKTEEEKGSKGRKETKKKKEQETKIKKTEAIAKKSNVPVSTKHSIAICKFIRRKKIDKAIKQLGEVIEMKRAIPMKGELPHRKGKGMERGRYPIKAVKEFIKLLRQISANAVVNGLDIDKVKIECKADKAARPYRRFGRARFKRTNILLKLKMPKRNKAK